MPLLETKGAGSAQGFGLTLGGAAPVYIEDVFSTWLYTGNGSTQTITNGVDLAGKGGLVWFKSRNNSTFANSPNCLTDSVTGFSKYLISEQTQFQQNWGADGPVPKSYGFDLPINGSVPYTNYLTGSTYVSWTFRKQPKFFDVVTYTGNGTSNRAISHSLGSAPGCVIVKRLDAAVGWNVYHRGVSPANNNTMQLNTTAEASSGGQDIWGNGVNVTTPTETAFYVAGSNNNNGSTYVAYIFAHDAGGFGLTGTDNVISCGSFTTDGSGNATVSLGYEPQWILMKRSDSSSGGNWYLLDTMRGLSYASNGDGILYANTSAAEIFRNVLSPTATGFVADASSELYYNATYIYIAIRRGPMKTPTSGTSVFNPVARTGTGTNPTVVTTNNNPDLLMSFPRTASPAAYGMCFWDKLRGISPMLQSASTSAETNTNTTRVLQGWLNTGYQAGADFIEGYLNYSGSTYVNYPITRAPGFFDEVCNTITSFAVSGNHNLGVVPQMIIGKRRDSTSDWFVYHIGLTGVNSQGKPNQQILLNSSAAPTTAGSNGYYVDLTATTYDTFWWPSTSGTAVLYFFASVPGVSKVGSYTGNGSSQTIDMGFTGGARFFLVKRSDNVGSWLVYDSARGIVAPNDPALQLNSTAAEITSADAVDPASVGIIVNQENTFNININGGTYIYLAIA